MPPQQTPRSTKAGPRAGSGLRCWCGRALLARLLVLRVLAAVGAELLQLEPVGVVAPVLLRDVVAVLALLARQRDLRADVGGGHAVVPALSSRCRTGDA